EMSPDGRPTNDSTCATTSGGAATDTPWSADISRRSEPEESAASSSYVQRRIIGSPPPPDRVAAPLARRLLEYTLGTPLVPASGVPARRPPLRGRVDPPAPPTFASRRPTGAGRRRRALLPASGPPRVARAQRPHAARNSGGAT